MRFSPEPEPRFGVVATSTAPSNTRMKLAESDAGIW